MENRRPPRTNSSGRKQYLDRDRGPSTFRGGGSTDSGTRRPPGRTTSTGGVRRFDRNGRPTDARSGGFNRRDGNRLEPTRPGAGVRDGRTRPGARKRDKPEIEIRITSDAQITDGRLRGRSLANSVSPQTVPTKRKLREITFKVLSRRVKAARILDLGAGAGTIGIEAISRGAMHVTFVERSARMCTYLRRNLADLGVKDGHGEVVEMEILPFLIRSGRRKRVWDLIYLHVPEGDDCTAIVDHLGRGNSLPSGGLLLFEHASTSACPDHISNLKSWRTIDQGETILSIYERI